jgi:ribosome modulation factor
LKGLKMTPYLRGYQEYENGVPLSDNPYANVQLPQAHADWHDGWQAAKAENENPE